MKKLIFAGLLSTLIGSAFAQQLPLYSQYVFNSYALNPAVAGSQDFYDVKSNHRYQWVGVTDAPRTYTLSVQGPMKNHKMGLGGFLYTDNVGPTRRTGFQLSYAYHLQVTSDIKLAFGVSGGLLQFTVDGGKITLHDEGDVALTNGLQSVLLPDAKAGIYLYSPNKFYFGLSAPQLIQNNLLFFDNQNNTLSQLEDHYYAAAGYTYQINDDFEVEPSVLLKYVTPAPLQADLTGRVIYRRMVWLGATYRTDDAVSAMVGYTYKQSLMFGYSYDFTTSNLQNYSNGTHEVMIGVRFIRPEPASEPSIQ